jgi:hypothetical protein
MAFITSVNWDKQPPTIAIQQGLKNRIIHQTPQVDIETNRYAFAIIYVAQQGTDADFKEFYKSLLVAAANDQLDLIEDSKKGDRYQKKLEKLLSSRVKDQLVRDRIIKNCSYLPKPRPQP